MSKLFRLTGYSTVNTEGDTICPSTILGGFSHIEDLVATLNDNHWVVMVNDSDGTRAWKVSHIEELPKKEESESKPTLILEDRKESRMLGDKYVVREESILSIFKVGTHITLIYNDGTDMLQFTDGFRVGMAHLGYLSKLSNTIDKDGVATKILGARYIVKQGTNDDDFQDLELVTLIDDDGDIAPKFKGLYSDVKSYLRMDEVVLVQYPNDWGY